MLEELPELQLAAHTADQQPRAGEDPAARPRVELQRDGSYLRVSPGAELASLCLNLEVFAKAVLDPAGDDARTAKGAIAHSASAWSRGLGLATGAVAETGDRPTGRTVDHPGAAPDPPPVSL